MVISFPKMPPPTTEQELLARCSSVEGMSFSQLSMQLGLKVPEQASQRKGWVGQAIELVLGADASNQALPDFTALGIELKTLPVALSGKPTESTFITTIPLLTIHEQSWHTSQCFAKLKRVLWVPIEGDTKIPYAQRRIGRGFIWSPDAVQEQILAADWTYLTTQIALGQLEQIDATVGEYLQVRPKAADGRSLCYSFDAQGNRVQTLPRGFYLRSHVSHQIMLKALYSSV